MKNASLNNEISWRTVFDFKLNFENKVSYRINTSNVEKAKKNSLKSINNSFKIIAKPIKKISIIPTFEYFLPDTKRKTDYFFIDSTIKYAINRNWELSFFAKNILNKRLITEIDINDYSINTTSMAIIPRYFLLNITYNF